MCSSKEILSFEDSQIELIEEVELNQRFIRERYWIEYYNDLCVNILIPSGKSRKEYLEEHKEHRKEYSKQYYRENKEQMAQKIICECGIEISKYNLARHKKSKPHQDKMNQITHSFSGASPLLGFASVMNTERVNQ